MGNKNWIILLIITCITIIVFNYWQMKNAQKKLDDYLLAINCPNVTNCREKIEAKIIKGNSVILNLAGGKGISLRETYYNIYLSSDSFDSKRVKVLGSPLTDGTPFDISNVITLGTDSNFAKYNLQPERVVYIEFWRGQITFIFFDVIFKPTEIQEQSNTPAIFPNTDTRNYDIAIPTSNHPLILSSKSKSDFYGYGVIFGTVLFFCITGLIFVPKDNKRKTILMKL
ncbi:MAG: hypothetical protein JNK81_07205 [Anaerolineales bacterium]|nr:hypothetical protein [Anaerolineales bacterium]